VYTTDIDNTQEPSSNADGTSANEENFAVQLLQTITRSTISATVSATAFGELQLSFPRFATPSLRTSLLQFYTPNW